MMTEKLKVAVVGIGNMGSAHAKHIQDGAIENCVLTAVCDIDSEKLAWARQTLGEDVKLYSDYHQLMDDRTCDAILIATPHYLHPVIAIEAFEKGYHVLSEKPAGVYTKKVREMNEAAVKSGKVFAMMFNQRTNPTYRKVREIIKSGELGEPKRLVWVITNWYRTQAYYDSGTWRATWEGEGGGVLLNQCPHQLDLWQWMFGMPKSIRAKCAVGKYHNIEVEDDVTITAEYENGATATFITSTGEYPGCNHLIITGDRGKIVVEDGKKITFTKLAVPEREFCYSSDKAFLPAQDVPRTEEVYEFDSFGTQHIGILQNFVNHILHHEELISSGYEGINALTISNAAFLSDWIGKEIALPMDEDLYYELLQEKIKNSKVNLSEKVAKHPANDGSYGTYQERWKGNR
ncbi:MAG: Gfo/Idh/MocA family oxidoreductase [Ruminococcaceae bacterium]|nr:Gfo/Idh/MocA family oxidoreductase [Oscillospiraceae bacterium]